jgi:hypothetical protein
MIGSRKELSIVRSNLSFGEIGPLWDTTGRTD